ncbi:MAG TPA: UDP-N-acetylmuramoyl-L-alanyl-D-glutamate--2,6-diaminopimelate ligase [Saprospiraceae bacterium]|nr:UDP-N-acetylmuramoyl-L-alanyl-D-glutamate--2,6-diaminopimelate ligase [Saprospiraceae bacterium]
MKRLRDILPNAVSRVVGNTDREIKDIVLDSRRVGVDSMFIAMPGTRVDGHEFISVAIHAGAGAIVCQHLPEQIEDHVTYIQVENVPQTLGYINQKFFDNPSRKTNLVGVTGTNGKTTIATLLYQLFTRLGYKAGLISTIEIRVGDRQQEASHTTPDNITLNRLLAVMVEEGCDYVFMEVSSHALEQQRVAGLHYAGAVFTNLTHDHLDYHGTFQAYLNAKKKLFDVLDKQAFALINIDDKHGTVMVQNTKAKVLTYSLLRPADIKGKIIQNSIEGLQLQINRQNVFTRLTGRYNASNLLAVYGSAIELGQGAEEVLTAISALHPAKGRFEVVIDPALGKTAVVDYAHTPDALEKVLQAMREVRQPGGKIITVVGCGGNRDKAKRPVMAKVSALLSDQIVLTSDNPRDEEPDAILADMWAGLDEGDQQGAFRITDRHEAIRIAWQLAKAGDIVLIAGKGHETYQEIKGKRYPFDDKAEIQALISQA